MKKIYMVTDLGPGDGGKGGVVHKLSHQFKAHTIIKVGGAQGSHGVRTAGEQSFAFSQFGCGTFEGVRTHISPRFVADPVGIVNEANALRYQAGVHDPLSLLSVDERVLCNTPFHGIASRIKELSLGNSPRGTVGTGVGQAYRLNETRPDLSLHVKDLGQRCVRDKLFAIREQIVAEMQPLLEGTFLSKDKDLLQEETVLLSDDGFIEYLVSLYENLSKELTITNEDYFASCLLQRDGVMVVESSHGILTDRYTGFHPHTSALRTLPVFTKQMFADAGYDGTIVSLGIHRAYEIRHGAGPMPTANPMMSDSLLPGSNKDENRWQGKVRVGPLDLVLLQYALAASGENVYDGICLTWFDQVEKNGVWEYCNRYAGKVNPDFFINAGNIKVRVGEDESQLQYLEQLTKVIFGSVPEVTKVSLPNSVDRNQMYDLVAGTLLEHIGVPVRMISFGPTERDKILK